MPYGPQRPVDAPHGPPVAFACGRSGKSSVL
jgi:hypothetical protein